MAENKWVYNWGYNYPTDIGVSYFTPFITIRIRGPPCCCLASSLLSQVAFDYVLARSHASESHQVQATGRVGPTENDNWGRLFRGRGRSIACETARRTGGCNSVTI